jgi:hypothetical protein
MDPFSDLYPVFWKSPTSPLQSMGTLGPGLFSFSDALNNWAQAVGASAGHAFIWSPRTGILDLNSLIPQDQGITLTRATAINDRGVIASWGVNSLGEECSYLLTPPEPRPVKIDIRPNVCPNNLNLKSHGHVPVAVLGTADFDVTQIDLSSVRLMGVAPVSSSYADIATPPGDGDCECSTAGADGYPDLVLEFKTSDLVPTILRSNDLRARRPIIRLRLDAFLSNDTRIQGTDCVQILNDPVK